MNDEPNLGRACALLVVVIDELRGLRSDLSARKAAKQPQTLSASDMQALLLLLPAISAAIGDESFTVGSLRVAAQARTRAAKTLRAALAAAAPDPLRLGHLLKHAAESETQICSLFIHRIGKFRGSVGFTVDTKPPKDHAAACFAANMSGKMHV